MNLIICTENLLVNPGVGHRSPSSDLLGLEPQRNLLLGAVHRVTAVANVAWTSEQLQTTYRPTCRQKSPRMVPGAESAGRVSPSILRPVATAPRPSQTYGEEELNWTIPCSKLGRKPCTQRGQGRRASSTSQRSAQRAAPMKPGHYNKYEGETCFSLRATRRKPFCSKRLIISPTWRLTLKVSCHQPTLHAVGLDHDVSLFLVGVGSHFESRVKKMKSD